MFFLKTKFKILEPVRMLLNRAHVEEGAKVLQAALSDDPRFEVSYKIILCIINGLVF